MKKTFFTLSVLSLLFASGSPLFATRAVQTQDSGIKNNSVEDIRVILESCMLNSKMEPYFTMMAAEAISDSGKEIDSEELLGKFREMSKSNEMIDKLAKPYKDLFSPEEIHSLKLVYEEPTFQKYMNQGAQIMQANLETIKETFTELTAQYNTEKKIPVSGLGNIIEVTKENFQEVIGNATMPLIIDVYSTSCGPCRMMEPILKELSNQYNGSVQFVKINCDTQPELAVKYGVSKLPTFLFVKPGQEAIALKATGFTSKKELNEKILKFVQ